MKNIIVSIMMCLVAAGAVAADDYKIIVSNPAGGGGTDMIARRIADEYNKNTGKNLVVVNKPGGNAVIAVNEFKQEKLAVIVGHFSMHIYNYMTMANSMPYQDSNFRHLVFFGEQPGVYFVQTDSPIRNINDFFTKQTANTDTLIGSHATNTFLNVMSLKKNKDSRFEPVNYKSPNDMIVDVIGGRLPIGFTSLGGTSLVEMEKQGRIRFIANSTQQDLRVNDKLVPSLSRHSGVQQFNGAAIMSITPGNTEEHKKLTNELLKIVNDPEFRAWLQKNWIIPVPHDPTKVTDFLSTIRKDHVSKSDWIR